ncbi:MAG: hypothetical protein E7116_09750 [Bacteroidales bacterium]|nr:hypothetical protein [Bacteroidales bacterium]
MKTRILSAAMMMAIVSVVSCTEEIASPQQPAGPSLQEEAVTVHAVMDEGMTKVTLGDDRGETTPVYWDENDQIGIKINETTYTFDRTDDAVGSKTADFEYKAGEPALPELTAGKYTFTYPASGKASLASQTGTKDGLKAYHYMEATFTVTDGQNWNNLPGLSFETKVAIVKLTLMNEAFKGKEVTEVTLRSAGATYTATSVFAGTDADGSIVVYLAVEPASLTDCIITAICETKTYEAGLSDNTLVAGKLYRVSKTMETYIDLSPAVEGQDGKYRTANSYIVSEDGYYKFKAVKGNGTEAVGSASDKDPEGTPTTAVVLWETFGTDTAPQKGDLVKADVEYRDGYVYFSTADTYQEGNAVIAVKDGKGTADTEDDVILWSWHIWLTDKPAEHVYNNSAGTMMDRNLGATSAAKGDVGALGLLYQWGRKDPFLGSSSTSSNTEALSTLTWPSPVMRPTLAHDATYHVANPTTFITSNSTYNFDWYISTGTNYYNDRWPDSGSPKSMYDPCPAGWRVPDGGENGIWAKAHGSSETYTHTYDSNKKGHDFSGDFGESSPIWYPVVKRRSYETGNLSSDSTGCYWSCSPTGNTVYYLYTSSSNVNPASYAFRAFGQPVRCCKE